MKTKYKYITFEKDTDWPIWYGWPKRLPQVFKRTVLVRETDRVWKAQHNHLLTTAEYRDVADFLEQLNRECKA